jgi:uncharacterized SAM-dependent methyltransferase
MHLVSRRSQHVSVPGAGVSIDLEPGEPIWTESSYKYDPAEFSEMLRRTGFVPAQQWIDHNGQFLLVAALVANSPPLRR